MKKFITEMLSNGQNVSSKRVLGSIGFLSAIIFISLWARDEIPTLLIVSASLVGLETVSNFFRPKS